MTNTTLKAKLDAGNSHVRLDDGNGVSMKPRRGFLQSRATARGLLSFSAMSLVAFAVRATPEPVLRYAADEGVTVEGGAVTKWANLGSLGADGDLSLSGSDISVAENVFGSKSAVRFAGNGFLEAGKTSSYGLTQGAGAAIFIVSKWDASNAGAPIGIDTGTASKRFYCDFLGKSNDFRFFYFFASGNGCLCAYGNPKANPLQTMMVRTDNKVFGRLSGSRLTQETWQGNVCAGTVCDGKFRLGSGGHSSISTPFAGDIAEVLVYNRSLSAAECARVELELAAKYGLTVATIPSCGAAEVAEHLSGDKVIGTDPASGEPSAFDGNWNDGILHFSFANAPAAADNSLTYVGTDGGSAEFEPLPSSSREAMPRTWYVAPTTGSLGGVFQFDCDLSDIKKWNYRLYWKATGSSTYSCLAVQPQVSDGKLTFSLDNIASGVYQLRRGPAGMGLFIIVR